MSVDILTTARANVAERYRKAGRVDLAARVEAGEDGYFAVRHEVLRLEREAGK